MADTYRRMCLSSLAVLLISARAVVCIANGKLSQKSPADARVTRDSSACMKAPESKLSRKPHPRTKYHVSMLNTAGMV